METEKKEAVGNKKSFMNKRDVLKYKKSFLEVVSMWQLFSPHGFSHGYYGRPTFRNHNLPF